MPETIWPQLCPILQEMVLTRAVCGPGVRHQKSRCSRWDSNPQPRDYESPALTVELQERAHGGGDYASHGTPGNWWSWLNDSEPGFGRPLTTTVYGAVGAGAALAGCAAWPAGTGLAAGAAITTGDGACAVDGDGCAKSVAVIPQTPMITGIAKSNKARSDETDELNA